MLSFLDKQTKAIPDQLLWYFTIITVWNGYFAGEFWTDCTRQREGHEGGGVPNPSSQLKFGPNLGYQILNPIPSDCL